MPGLCHALGSSIAQKLLIIIRFQAQKTNRISITGVQKLLI